MIFVCLAYENVKQHTAGFLGLQFALVLIAIQNTLYIINADISYHFLGGLKRTRQVVITYLFLLLIIGSCKIAATVFVVTNGYGADWTRRETALGVVSGQVVDWIWMLFFAILPVAISIVRQRSEDPITALFFFDQRTDTTSTEESIKNDPTKESISTDVFEDET